MTTVEFSLMAQFGLLIIRLIGVVVAIIGLVVNAMKNRPPLSFCTAIGKSFCKTNYEPTPL